MNKKKATSSLRISDTNTYGVTCVPARRSYGGDKCGPYVYLKAAASPPTAPTSWPSGLLGHFCIHKTRTTTTPPSRTHTHTLPSSPPLLLFCVVFLPPLLLILPSIVTSLSLSLIHARQPPPSPPQPRPLRRSPHSSSVTRLSRGESGQEPG